MVIADFEQLMVNVEVREIGMRGCRVWQVGNELMFEDAFDTES